MVVLIPLLVFVLSSLAVIVMVIFRFILQTKQIRNLARIMDVLNTQNEGGRDE